MLIGFPYNIAYLVEYSGVQMGNTLDHQEHYRPLQLWSNKDNFILIEKTFNENEISQTDRISTKYGDKLKGRLDVIGCTFMEFLRGEDSGGSGKKCNLM